MHIRKQRKPKVLRVCENCNTEFFVWQSRIDIGKGKFCSTSCGKQREFNSAWKGGRRIVNGYVWVLKKDHPQANKRGYVLEHRLVVENKLGRYLKKTEVVHHINNIRDDNRIENLRLLSGQDNHIRLHMRGNKTWLGKKHKKETIKKMKLKWTVERKEKQKEVFKGKGNPNYRHGKYIT